MHMFEQKVRAYIEEMNLIAQGDHLLLACSGGVDSVALLHFLHRYKDVMGIQLSVVHVDHMLRGDVSLEDLEFVRDTCKQLGLPFYGRSINIPAILDAHGGNSQAVCRRERYAYFGEVMDSTRANVVVTAHHADDQLESVVMALTKGASTKSLAGIYPMRAFKDGQIIRPFLSVTKVEVREYLQMNHLNWREDSSNEQDDYLRNRFRHHVIPLLKEENPNITMNIRYLSEQLREDEQYLMGLAEARFLDIVTKSDENTYYLEVEVLKREPVALQRRLILILLNYVYVDTIPLQSNSFVTSILKLCDTVMGNSQIDLPNNFIVRRAYNVLTVEKVVAAAPFVSKSLTLNEWHAFDSFRLFIGDGVDLPDSQSELAKTYYFSSDTVSLPLTLRTVENGDRIHIKGMQQEKRVSRVFIDDKIPANERSTWPILVDCNNELLALLYLRISNKLSESKRPNDDLFIYIVDDSL